MASQENTTKIVFHFGVIKLIRVLGYMLINVKKQNWNNIIIFTNYTFINLKNFLKLKWCNNYVKLKRQKSCQEFGMQ